VAGIAHPIDRMANLNIEPGEQSLEQMIGGIEHGILMRTNRSWSIDDARNKFQFGCEWGQLIENGELKGVVKNPNYRAISAQFWKSLQRRRRCQHLQGARHAELRQGRTEPGDPRRPCFAGLCIQQR
jgi:predicted Zn-dependent protease